VSDDVQPRPPIIVIGEEPPQAHSLEWMPLAVRYKLDVLGLTIRLKQWQALEPSVRRRLLEMELGDASRRAACTWAFVAAGARKDPSRQREWKDFETYLRERVA
jgi:hypothetical protein